MDTTKRLLSVENLKTYFGDPDWPSRAVDGVSFSLGEGETMALVGESGCGKSVTALSLAKLLSSPPAHYAGGRVLLDGEDVLQMNERRLGNLRGKTISYVFQEPGTSLNPVFTVGYQIAEAVRLHRSDVDARKESVNLMKMVGLPDPERRFHTYPHEMSGGMQQRIMIAMALACRPKLLVADEPTTALDVTIQAQILELLRDLQRQLGMAVILITHNLGLVADMALNVFIMYAGRVVESGPTEQVLTMARHPYTRGLLDAVPRLSGREGKLKGIDGTVPNPARLPQGCKFAPRCSRAQEKCRQSEPDLTGNGRGTGLEHCVRCFFPYV